MQEQFTYAVARIRCKELMLLSEVDINRMLACNNYKECINILRDKGWRNEDSELENELKQVHAGLLKRMFLTDGIPHKALSWVEK